MSYTHAEVGAAIAAMDKYRSDEGEVGTALVVVGLSAERAAKEAQIRDDMIRVNLGKSGETSLLEINIEIDGAKPKPPPVRTGLAGATPARPS